MTDRPIPADFELVETTVADVHAAFEETTLTAEGLVEVFLDRIERYDDALNATITINEAAMDRARALDARFTSHGLTGPLHGIPVAIKDNHDTADMPTTAGSVRFAEFVPESDAVVVERLREAGAVIVAKANLQELSFGVDSVSSLGGETHNPYALDRRPSGSSGGTAAAVASNLAVVGTGTDTCSSVRSPPAFTNLVGLRPTIGLVSRTGIVPLSLTQDTAGPITRTVEDAARVLDVLVGFDPADPVTARGADQVPADGYVAHADPSGLEGARIGVLRDFFGASDPTNSAADTAPAVTATVEAALATMEAAGATVVDDVSLVDPDRLESARVVGDEFERDFDRYLAERPATPVDSLRELAESGTVAESVERRLLDGDILDTDVDTLETNPAYLQSLADREALRTEAIAGLVDADLDAVVYPPSAVLPVEIPEHQPFSEMRCELAAHTGLPAIVVPAGFAGDDIPVGLELLGRPFDEPRLFELAAGYEAAADHRRPPADFE